MFKWSTMYMNICTACPAARNYQGRCSLLAVAELSPPRILVMQCTSLRSCLDKPEVRQPQVLQPHLPVGTNQRLLQQHQHGAVLIHLLEGVQQSVHQRYAKPQAVWQCWQCQHKS